MSKALSSDTKAGLAVVSLTLLVSAALSLTPLFSFVDRILYDSFLKIKAVHYPEAPNPRIISVDLNDSSENELREAIDSRGAFADLLWTLGDCASFAVLDFVFKNTLGDGGPSPADLDLIQAAAGMKSLVLAAIPVPEKLANYSHSNLDRRSREILERNLWHIREMGANSIPVARSFILSFPALSDTASQLGHIGVEHDKDGVYRKTPLFYRWEDGLIPSLALAAAVRELRVDPRSIEFHPGKELILPRGPGDPPVRIPVDSSGYVRIPYTARWIDNLYRVSFARVAKARRDDELFDSLFDELSGSICLVVDTSTFKQDFGVTPIEAVFPRSGIYLAVMSAILNNSFYYDPHPAVKLTLCALTLIAVLLVGLQKKDRIFNAGFPVLVLAAGGLCYALWRCFSLTPFCGAPVFFISASWLGLFVLRQFSRYREQLLYRNALSRYFPRALVERIRAERSVDLRPAVKELSVLFADIASFTKWSSDKTPDTVHAFLSDYLESMASIIFEHGGTIDKFMGDGILAFFGDPFEQEDHAERAVRAAIAMQKKNASLREFWAPRVHINLMVRIGINTGAVIVGNLGSRTRVEYTVIGSTVNLGQRMESSAPPGGILVSAATRGAVRGPILFGGRRFVTVKGYDAPVECFEAVF
jgi:adenylate cyclase